MYEAQVIAINHHEMDRIVPEWYVEGWRLVTATPFHDSTVQLVFEREMDPARAAQVKAEVEARRDAQERSLQLLKDRFIGRSS